MPEFITPMTPDRPATVPGMTRALVAALAAIFIACASAVVGSMF